MLAVAHSCFFFFSSFSTFLIHHTFFLCLPFLLYVRKLTFTLFFVCWFTVTGLRSKLTLVYCCIMVYRYWSTIYNLQWIYVFAVFWKSRVRCFMTKIFSIVESYPFCSVEKVKTDRRENLCKYLSPLEKGNGHSQEITFRSRGFTF